MKEKGIKILFSIFLFASVLMPFSVSAEGVGGSSPIIGVNITYIGYDGEVVPYQSTVHFDTEQTMWRCTSSHSTMGCQVWESITSSGSDLDEITGTITTNATSTYTYRLYQYEFIFDKTYVGSITFNGNHPGATTTTTYYINGNRLVLTDVNLVTSFTIGSYSLTYAPLEVINTFKQWNFPFESFGFISPFINAGFTLHEYVDFNQFTYPIFDIPANSSVRLGFCPREGVELVFLMDRAFNRMDVNDYFKLNNASEFASSEVEVVYLNTDTGVGANGTFYSWYHYTLKPNTGGTLYFENKYSCKLIPVYYLSKTYPMNISTDFALTWGLSNKLLDNLQIIAQGTQQSNSAASGLESSNSTMASDMNSMATIENGYSQDFNSQLQNIDFTNPIQQNQGILPAANFVISIFNGLISNNPFTVLIIIICILLIGKKVIGK